MGSSPQNSATPTSPTTAQPNAPLSPQQAFELQIKAAERAHADETAFGAKANDAATKSGEEAIKAAMLVNGGSSVAMLAFVGTLASKDALSSTQLTQIVQPLLWFGGGVANSVVAAAAAYFTNLFIADGSNRRAREYVPPFVRPTAASRRRVVIAEAFRCVSVLAVALSIACFVGGLLAAKDAFKSLNSFRGLSPPTMSGGAAPQVH
ncbi:hypothetical protein V5279_37985 [Bradyrhizobium sp. 26S5]|uniref:hypothetical protein n=1 Tax=Bradyrhizobium sp. 26S5 TaxID=3139729 RepID=UPI0030D5356C